MKNTIKVFISHSHKDYFLAEKFKQIFLKFSSFSENEIFMSSGHPSDTSVKGYIPTKIAEGLKEAEYRIALLTPNYYESPNCNAEMGYISFYDDNPWPFLCSKNNDEAFLPFYLKDFSTFPLTKKNFLDLIKKIPSNKKLTKADEEEISTTIAKMKKSVPVIPNGIDYASMGMFVDACNRSELTIFFNVQVSFDDWFTPQMQTHLALQDATCTYYQLQHLIDVGDGEKASKAINLNDMPKYFGTPTARIMFVNKTQNDFINELNLTRNKKIRNNLADLTLIHFFMSTPLAIVTVDQLAGIMCKKKYADFFSNKKNCEVLGLPCVALSGRNKKNLELELNKKLEEMQLIQGIEESIDFSLLKKSGKVDKPKGFYTTQDGTYEIWKGKIKAAPRNFEYYNIANTEKVEALSSFGIIMKNEIMKIMPRTIKNGDHLASHLYEKELKKDSEKKPKEKFHKLISSRHPAYIVFHNDGLRKKFFQTISFVKPEYCPLYLFNKKIDSDKLFDLIPKEYVYANKNK